MWCHLKDCLCGVALHVVSVDDNLNDAIPNFFADVVTSNADEVENGVHVPGVINSILFCQYGHFQHLNENEKEKLPAINQMLLSVRFKVNSSV